MNVILMLHAYIYTIIILSLKRFFFARLLSGFHNVYEYIQRNNINVLLSGKKIYFLSLAAFETL
jgi:hypothetical protein